MAPSSYPTPAAFTHLWHVFSCRVVESQAYLVGCSLQVIQSLRIKTPQWLFLVPVKGDRWYSPSPNWQEKYHLYIAFNGYIIGGLGPGGLGFESGYPEVTIPFIFGDPRNPNHRAPNHQLTISWPVRWHRNKIKNGYASNPKQKRICLYNIFRSMHVWIYT